MITLNDKQIKDVERSLSHIPGAIPKAISRALNRAAETARTEASRKVRDEYIVKNSDILNTMRITKAAPGNLVARVTSSSSSIPLIRFKVTPNAPQPLRKAPIIARVKKNGGGPVTHAFVAKMGSGYTGVFQRAGKKRFPIKQLYGPSIPTMLGTPLVSAWVEQKAIEALDKRLDHEIDRILEGNQ
jgi:hypothetical protein